MKIRCDYCGSQYEDTLSACPNCAAPNPRRVEQRDGGRDPQTIEELEAWYQAHNLPPYETTRFFIGIDYQEPRAFGIYRDRATGEVVVYKNKADGTRAVRYRGKDEPYAVNEILTKLKDEILKQKVHNGDKGGASSEPKSDWKTWVGVVASILVIIALAFAVFAFINRNNGYYAYDDVVYYREVDDWYYYDDYDDEWVYAWDVPERLTDDTDAYYVSGEWDSSLEDYGVTEPVEDSDAYEEYSSSSDDNDDYDWDDDDGWDSDDTDWDSDW